MTIEQEINEAVKKLVKCGDMYRMHRQRVASLGGAYASAAAESAAPKSKRAHKRYNTAKVVKAIRAPKGRGNVVATYYPGNLGRSLQVMKFNRAKSKVFVGAKLARTARGNFNGRRVDGYYLHMVEEGTKHSQGTRFFHSSWQRSKNRVYTIMKNEFQRLGAKFEAQNKIR